MCYIDGTSGAEVVQEIEDVHYYECRDVVHQAETSGDAHPDSLEPPLLSV